MAAVPARPAVCATACAPAAAAVRPRAVHTPSSSRCAFWTASRRPSACQPQRRRGPVPPARDSAKEALPEDEEEEETGLTGEDTVFDLIQRVAEEDEERERAAGCVTRRLPSCFCAWLLLLCAALLGCLHPQLRVLVCMVRARVCVCCAPFLARRSTALLMPPTPFFSLTVQHPALPQGRPAAHVTCLAARRAAGAAAAAAAGRGGRGGGRRRAGGGAHGRGAAGAAARAAAPAACRSAGARGAAAGGAAIRRGAASQ